MVSLYLNLFWHLTFDNWHLTFDIWHLTLEAVRNPGIVLLLFNFHELCLYPSCSSLSIKRSEDVQIISGWSAGCLKPVLNATPNCFWYPCVFQFNQPPFLICFSLNSKCQMKYLHNAENDSSIRRLSDKLNLEQDDVPINRWVPCITE